jgi:hypothetical protein
MEVALARNDLLEDEISEARRSISSDGYPMSIGELTNLYKDGELIIRPEFQRFFRWTQTQRSRLVESLLLGIPLPSIFVAQTETGTWELIDGLQRLSTILELQGELRGKDKERLPALQLESTKYLPHLEGKSWATLTDAQRLDVKRAKIDVKIIKRESSQETKFDLFQRLNSYGSSLTSSELRSALLVAVSPDYFAWLEELSTSSAFVDTTLLSERLIDERYDLELVTRFLVLHNWDDSKLKLSALRDLPQILDDASIELAGSYPKGFRKLASTFHETFDVIVANGGEDVFRRWDPKRQEFKGSFLNTAFEVFALGIGYHIANGNRYRSDLLPAVKEFWSKPEMQKGFATGRSTEARLIDFIPAGRELLAA